MNIIVVGAGAIGCYVGGRLAAAGENVTLVGRPRTTEPLVLGGLTVSDLQGFKAHIAVKAATSFEQAWLSLVNVNRDTNIILLCVKGGATMAAVQEITAVCPAGTTIVSLQNGVDNVARINKAAPQMYAVAGMVPYNVVMKMATHVHRATMGKIYIERSGVMPELVDKFNSAGLRAVLSTDMPSVQWGKLLLNVNNPVNALSDLPLREQLLSRDFRHVFATLQLEALAAMRASNIIPMQLAAVKPNMMPLLLKLPNWIFTRLAKKMLRMDASARSSMWDDVQQGRTTEIDDLCGAVVRLAQLAGRQAPCNAKMCEIMAKHTKGHRFTGLELRKALGI